VRVYGPRDTRDRGASVALNVLDASGELWNCERVESLANERQISVRSGCHCNPGARKVALGYPRSLLAGCLKDTENNPVEEFMRASRGCRDGVVRVSLGIASNFEDAYRFVDFARSFTDRHAPLDQRAPLARRQCQGCRRWRGRTDGRNR
jgi:selenocysteine lyase/cysteine desulfurase